MKQLELAENAVVAERFRLNKLLGRGGMGSVWLAMDLSLDVPCAIKFIEGEFAALPEAQARFEREAKAAASLRSPHVVQIYQHGISEGRPFIAMELLEGEDLGKRLGAQGKLAPPDLVRIMDQVCRALTKAHALGIVHRDLKPDNIFLVKDDEREIAKVLDFGIAKSSVTGNSISGSNTKTGAMLGTPYYMSPEQAQGTKSVDHRSDLWSLAVICYQALTGSLPFESEALGDLLVKIIVQEIPVPSRAGPVPPGFDEWWRRAASRDPAARFQNAREFSQSLAMALGLSSSDTAQYAAVRGSDGGVPARPMMGIDPALAHGQTPQPFGMTPGPGAGTGQHLAHMATGAPISRTFGGTDGLPKKPPLALIIGGVAVTFLFLAGVGTAVVYKFAKNDAPAIASPLPPASSPAAMPSTPPAVTAEPVPTPPASSAPVAAAAQVAGPAKQAANDTKEKDSAKTSSTSGHRTKPAASASAAPAAAPAKPVKGTFDKDLGI